jgi:hypothetical protein
MTKFLFAFHLRMTRLRQLWSLSQRLGVANQRAKNVNWVHSLILYEMLKIDCKLVPAINQQQTAAPQK